MDYSSRRTAQPYLEALAARTTPQAVTAGASSYFTAPTASLDPNLFDKNERLKPSIRTWLSSTILDELGNKYHHPTTWLHVWIAGSGASYQWSAARDPGDLDILLGVDYVLFREANIMLGGLSDLEIADSINEYLQQGLWTRTANQQVGSSHYEVTWYCNPRSTDIRAIHPYAAYDVLQNTWAVRPIDLPKAGPGEWFPKEFAAAADRDRAMATTIVGVYNEALSAANSGDEARQVTARTMLSVATRQATALFDEIHQGRHAAFDETGEGYRDYANYRWQAAKLQGVIGALKPIHDAGQEARKAVDLALYGQALQSTEHVRIEAATAGHR